MRSKVYVKIIAAVLLCFQLLMLAACNGSGKDTEDTTPGSTVESTTGPGAQTTDGTSAGIDLVENGKAKYKVVRPDSASGALVTAVGNFRTELSAAVGVEFGIASDWVRPGTELDPDAFEILVGYTNRPASAPASEGLNNRDYTICISGNAIVIAGGSDKALIAAMDVFLTQCVNGQQLKLTETISHIEPLACPDFSIGGTPAGQFVAVYSSTAEDEEGKTISKSLYEVLEDNVGVKLSQVSDSSKNDSEHKIFIGNTKDVHSQQLYAAGFDTYNYCLEVKDGQLYIAGGSCFALQYCVNMLRDEYLLQGKSLDDGLTLTGTMFGKQIYNLEPGAEVRIMSNNVWECDTNQPAWQALGEDCSAKKRAEGLAAVYMAYAPDVICLQEMSALMIRFITQTLKNYGWNYTLLSYSTSASNDFTCILYRGDTLELLDKGHHSFSYGNNHGTKSYTWGYFKHTATGKTFTALSTHLWWKSESAEAGSDKMRERQAGEIVEAMNKVIEKYDAPVYIMGDFNTRTTTDAYKVFTDGGFQDTFNLATVFASNHRGRHTCGPEGFARETSPETYKDSAIDHILIKNGKATEIMVFNHVRPYFYIKLSDHYPLYVDAVLG